MSLKIWAISDTHGKHGSLMLPNKNQIDLVIHAGDASSRMESSINDAEMRDFLTWFNNLPYKYKIYVPGNHDTSIEANFHNFANYPNVIFLINNSVTIENTTIFGSPQTPTYGTGWSYNTDRDLLHNYWNRIPENTDIVVTHGPPRGILDYMSVNDVTFIQIGCSSLARHIKRVDPVYHIFGHCHQHGDSKNCGIFQPNDVKYRTQYLNVSSCDTRHKLINNGACLEIDNYEKRTD